MNRREFIAGLGSAAAWPLAARAQEGRVRRVGVLMNGTANGPEEQARFSQFVQELRRLGWSEGQNVAIDVRWSGANDGLARTYAAQLVGVRPDVVLAVTTINLAVTREATSAVPIVFLQVSDPVVQGFVASMNQPGGNITGFSNLEFSIGGKWLDLLKAAAPSLTRVAYLFNPDTSPQTKYYVQPIEAAARSHGVQAIAMPVRTTAEIEPALGLVRKQLSQFYHALQEF